MSNEDRPTYSVGANGQRYRTAPRPPLPPSHLAQLVDMLSALVEVDHNETAHVEGAAEAIAAMLPPLAPGQVGIHREWIDGYNTARAQLGLDR